MPTRSLTLEDAGCERNKAGGPTRLLFAPDGYPNVFVPAIACAAFMKESRRNPAVSPGFAGKQGMGTYPRAQQKLEWLKSGKRSGGTAEALRFHGSFSTG